MLTQFRSPLRTQMTRWPRPMAISLRCSMPIPKNRHTLTCGPNRAIPIFPPTFRPIALVMICDMASRAAPATATDQAFALGGNDRPLDYFSDRRDVLSSKIYARGGNIFLPVFGAQLFFFFPILRQRHSDGRFYHFTAVQHHFFSLQIIIRQSGSILHTLPITDPGNYCLFLILSHLKRKSNAKLFTLGK